MSTSPSTDEANALPLRGETLRIGDVAELTGLTQRTIRYYEELGLLAPATRTQGDYRVFSSEDVERLQRIRELRDVLGFSLAEIRKVLDSNTQLENIKSRYRNAADVGERLQRLEEALALTEGQIELIDRKIEGMHRLRGELTERLEKYRARKRELHEMLDARGHHVE
jgi:MerR family transcriptional regulator, repressor of the yfmOP operon